MWFNNLKKKKEDPQQQHTLTDIIRGIQWAVNSAIHATENQYISTLQKFFEKQEDGSYKALEVEISVDENHCMKVPLISLVNPNGLVLDNMKVEMSVKINSSKIKNLYKEDIDEESNVTRTSFDVGFTKKNQNGDSIKLSMEFKAGETPEGVPRLLEQIVNNIQPIKKVKKEN